MPISITTQQEMRVSRKVLRHCYICADPLSADSGNGPLSRDHVIPTALRGPEPEALEERWSPMLPVHRRCEDNHKARRDQLAKVISVFGAVGPRAWSTEEFNLFRKTANVQLIDDEEMGHFPAITNAEDVILAAWLWVRGMHALLYGSSLPEEVSHFTRSPAPSFIRDAGSPAQQRREEISHKDLILNLLRAAIHHGEVDTLRAWGGAIHYQCVWRLDTETQSWDCFWALDLAGTTDWAKSVRGVDCPWYGKYPHTDKPPLAALISAEVIERHNLATKTPSTTDWT